MDLLQNPFYVLTATQGDNQRRIMELAEERGLLLNAHACMEAQAVLTNPRKRISAEVAWLPGTVPERAYDMLMLLESSAGNHPGSDKTTSIAPVDSLAAALSRLPYAKEYNVADKVLRLLRSSETGEMMEVEKFLGIDRLEPIARANLLAARMARLPSYTPNVVANWILAIAKTFEAISPAEVRAILNKERRASGFPEITDLAAIEAEIRNRRLYYQQVIKATLENILTAKARVRAVMMAVESATDSDEKRWPILIEDTVDSYEVGAQAFLETAEKSIEKLNKEFRIAAENEEPDVFLDWIVDGLILSVKDWEIVSQPIQLNKNRQGLRHHASHYVANCVRELAIHLFNEYDKLHYSQQILDMLQEVFAGVPEIVERITADLETLNKIAGQREQKES